MPGIFFILDKINCLSYSFFRVKSPEGGFVSSTELAKTNRKTEIISEMDGERKYACLCAHPVLDICTIRSFLNAIGA